MKQYFQEDVYKTPEDEKRFFMSRIPVIRTLSFYVRYIIIIIKASYKVRMHRISHEALYETSLNILKLVEAYGGRCNIEGIDILRRTKDPVVFIANHMSTLETQIMPILIGTFKPSCYVVKKSLVEGPVFGPIMRTNNPIALARKNPKVDLDQVVSQGTDRLSNKISVVLFPQGTRTTEFDRANFNSLGVKLSGRAGVRCVPVALKTDFWGDNKYIRGFGKIDPKKEIHLKFGEPLEITGGGKKQHQQILDFIEENLIAWGHLKKKED